MAAALGLLFLILPLPAFADSPIYQPVYQSDAQAERQANDYQKGYQDATTNQIILQEYQEQDRRDQRDVERMMGGSHLPPYMDSNR